MNKTFAAIIFSLVFLAGTSFAQRSPAPALDRDPVMESDALHNLDVARQAFMPGKKAYKAVLMRFEETYAAYPDFSKIDEFLYLAGMSSVNLADGKGKQKIDPKNKKDADKYAPEKLRENARVYFSTIVEKYPQSKFAPESKEMLVKLDSTK